jgi:beta-phosphoglucomutase-like phosphatase (HAD superfamily)
MKNNTKYLIFDFDGVFARTAEDNARMHFLLNTYGTQSLEETIEITRSKFSKTKHAKHDNLSHEELKKQLERIQYYGDAVNRIDNTIFTEFANNIANIPNTKLAVVSSGSNNNVIKNSKLIGLDFDLILCAEDSLYKDDKVQTVCDYWGVNPTDCFYFTDTVSDVLELQGLMGNSRIIGCTWGWSGKEELLRVLPSSQILEGYSDIQDYDFDIN